MKTKTSGKFIKHLLILQILIVIGIGICEVIQLMEIDKSQEAIIYHLKDWEFLIGYTKDKMTITAKLYYFASIFISIGILGWSLSTFKRRWENIQEYSDMSRNIWLFVLWAVAVTPNAIILSSIGISACSESSYTYIVTPELLNQCNAYLASLFLAYMLILSIIIQLLFHFVIVQHQKKIHILKQQAAVEVPKLTRVRRSKRVSKRKSSTRNNSILTNSTRLSVVTETSEEKSIKSNKSDRSIKSIRGYRNNRVNISDQNAHNNELNDEKSVYSNV